MSSFQLANSPEEYVDGWHQFFRDSTIEYKYEKLEGYEQSKEYATHTTCSTEYTGSQSTFLIIRVLKYFHFSKRYGLKMLWKLCWHDS